jgi:hypothetical protein
MREGLTGHITPNRRNDKNRNLEKALAEKMWPTPAAQDHKNGTLPPSQAKRDTLPGEIIRRMLPTPHSSCSTGAGHQGRQGGMNLQTVVAMENNQQSGRLNPLFVQEMMGYPIGWLDLKP